MYACTSFALLSCLKSGVREARHVCTNNKMIASAASMLEIAVPFVKAAWFGFGGAAGDDGVEGGGACRAARGFMDFLSMSAARSESSDDDCDDDYDEDEVSDDNRSQGTDNNDNNNGRYPRAREHHLRRRGRLNSNRVHGAGVFSSDENAAPGDEGVDEDDDA
jgi:hypothetical protein